MTEYIIRIAERLLHLELGKIKSWVIANYSNMTPERTQEVYKILWNLSNELERQENRVKKVKCQT